ncbi:MAG: methionine--tRNA ligase [Candidatus Aenigmatarchaeota archaeon]|nr:MAG: methionine--tRNA ligase [Candidatus Aenigmarchaeota archaeon]
MVEKFFITTPIYYPNREPTIGSAYTTIAADVLARWNRLKGKKVFFLTGLDENSIKVSKAAKEAGYQDVQRYVDEMAKKWIEVWKKLKISWDGFIRTTEERHKKVVREFFRRVWEKGDIYKGVYQGLYCEGCEAFLTESELVDGLCPLHKKKPKPLSEENYFFRLSRYQEKLLDYIEKNPDFIQPESRRNEVISFIKAGLKDISISRPGLDWGITLPVDESHRFWVWFDALLNYISGSEGNWPAELHLVGKDILRFHAVIWPAMLFSAEEPLPKRVYAHGFLTIDGQKISKSLGNAIDPIWLAEKYGLDTLRYFLLRHIPFGEDGDFSEKALVERHNGELVAELGNLVYRVLSLAERYQGEIKGEDELSNLLDFERIDKHMERLEFHHALEAIWDFLKAVNRYINEREPWKLEGEELAGVLYNLLEALRVIAILISPFMPDTAEKICQQLGVKLGNFQQLKFGRFEGKPKKGEMLFKKISA